MGRPKTIPTREETEKILKALLAGNFRNVAAQWAGVLPCRMLKWMKWGKEAETSGEDNVYRQFREAVLEAEKRAEVIAIGKIVKAGDDDPKHLQWWLERRHAARWGRDSWRIKQLETAIKEMEKKLSGDQQSY
jgi:hypothetical protein